MKVTGIKSAVLTISAVVLAGLGVGGGIWALQDKPAPAPKSAATQQTEQKPATYLAYDGEADKNALDLLQAHATVVTKDSSFGPYVDSINDVKGGTDGKYWSFYVNGEMSSVGAHDYITKAGDKIEWKFQ